MKDIIYVDKDDNEIGHGSIQKAIEEGIVRRISFVIISNSQGEVLLQKRGNVIGYPHRWNDSASGHVDIGETYLEAILREMEEEMGIKGVELMEVGKFYIEEFDGTWNRYAYGMVHTGTYDGEVVIDPSEVADFKWIEVQKLKKWLTDTPDDFTPGSVHAFNFLFEKQTKQSSN